MGKKFEFEFVSFTFDQLREMSEEDLYKNINSFRRRIREATRANMETQPFEVEFCYLEHERVMREKMKEVQHRLSRRNRQSSENRRDTNNYRNDRNSKRRS